MGKKEKPSRYHKSHNSKKIIIGDVIKSAIPFTVTGLALTIPLLATAQSSAPESDNAVSSSERELQSEYTLVMENGLEGYVRGLLNYYPSNDRQSREFTVDSYTLFNVYAGVRDASGAWDVSLVAKNALDTGKTLSRNFSEVQFPGAVQTNFGPAGYRATSYTAPREVGLSLRYNSGGG